jgi:hypothetical protein
MKIFINSLLAQISLAQLFLDECAKDGRVKLDESRCLSVDCKANRNYDGANSFCQIGGGDLFVVDSEDVSLVYSNNWQIFINSGWDRNQII